MPLTVSEAIITRARQRRMLAACDVDLARFGANADPSLLASDCIAAVRRGKVRAPERLIHLEQRLKVGAPFGVDQKLRVRAKVDLVEQTKDGEKAQAVFEFVQLDGTAVANATTLVCDPTWLHDLPPFKGDPRAGFRLVGRKLLNPAKVQAYSEDSGSRLHSDPALAVRYGLRAPVASGLMALTWAVEALMGAGLPPAYELVARIQAPLFWDDGVDVLVRAHAKRKPEIGTVRCVSSSGALVCETEVV